MTNQPLLTDIDVCVFDAYGTLFNVNAATSQCHDMPADQMESLSAIWRQKQLEYTWLRSLCGEYVDFWHITGQSLDYAMKSLNVENHALRARLMELYFALDAFPEVPQVLDTLKTSGMRTAILSNGAPSMLIAAVRHAGIERLVNETMSADAVRIYKPHPSVYQMAVDRLRVTANRICFLSSNSWDVSGAAYFGFRVVWVNRSRATLDQLPGRPEHEIRSLDELPALFGL